MPAVFAAGGTTAGNDEGGTDEDGYEGGNEGGTEGDGVDEEGKERERGVQMRAYVLDASGMFVSRFSLNLHYSMSWLTGLRNRAYIDVGEKWSSNVLDTASDIMHSTFTFVFLSPPEPSSVLSPFHRLMV